MMLNYIDTDCIERLLTFCTVETRSSFSKCNTFTHQFQLDWSRELHSEHNIFNNYKHLATGLKEYKTDKMKCMHIQYKMLEYKYEFSKTENMIYKQLESRLNWLNEKVIEYSSPKKNMYHEALIERENIEQLMSVFEDKKNKLASIQSNTGVFREYHQYVDDTKNKKRKRELQKEEAIMGFLMSPEFENMVSTDQVTSDTRLKYFKFNELFREYCKKNKMLYKNIESNLEKGTASRNLIIPYTNHKSAIDKFRAMTQYKQWGGKRLDLWITFQEMFP